MKALLLFSLLSLLPFGPAADADHQFHVSRCLIDYNEQESALQISLHLFIDDLEEALRRRGTDKLFICTEMEHEQAEAYMEKYIREGFILQAGSQTLDFHFLGKEVSDDLMAVWCYLEIPGIRDLAELKVTNKLLLEVFDDQKNLVHVAGPAKKQGTMLFQKGFTSEAIRF